ncbi:hypothetical protein AFV9_gp47 [Betalipothrixvirus uzonense]|uniref:Uncharacterized protein n=1 Tax=Betalipothrixvirus uzonense TaxID=512792 RepID=B2CRM4_9VIRU|nr:hypothetical protein AFV9_gp47 [Acidianus filamentous virus 9]ACB37281.1 hypothetical protein [Acidianus filamentous virus 9]
MSLCESWVQNVLPTGTVYKIATAYFMYNSTVVGQGSVTVSISYDKASAMFILTLTITDNSTNTYTYNAILVKDSNGNNVVLFQYSQAYNKGTGSLTVTEYIYINDVPPITEITSQFTASGDWSEIIANALVNGGAVYMPNSVFVFDDNYQAITQYNFTPTTSIQGTSYIEQEQISCTPCSSISGLYVVLAYYDQTSGTFIWVNYQYIASSFSVMNIIWSLSINPNC